MSDTNNIPPADEGEQGILASLPHTRPQRPSARRAAARQSAVKRASATTGKSTPSRPAEPKRPKAAIAGISAPAKPKRPKLATAETAAPAQPKRPKAPRTRAAKPAEPPHAPRQGFESEDELGPGASVAPPSSAELAASVMEMLGELAQSGLTSGGKMLKEALGRLPGS